MNLSDPSYTNDDKFRILAEQIDSIERKNEKEEFRKRVFFNFLKYSI